MPVNRRILLPIAIGLLALALRLPNLGSFMTADEANWMHRSVAFWQSIKHGDIRGTFLTTHPGVTGMWLIGGGIITQQHFTGLAFDDDTMGQFRLAATLPIAITTSIIVGIIVYLLTCLFTPTMAIIAGFLLAIDPYLTGLSQIAHLDALLALLMLASALSILWYKQKPTKKTLFLTSLLTALAGLTKLFPVLWLGIWGTIILWRTPRAWLKWVGLALVIFILAWPALWDPMHFGNKNYTSGLIFTFKDDLKAVSYKDTAAIGDSSDVIASASFYLNTLASRTTPFILFLSLVAAIILIKDWRRFRNLPIFWILIYLIGFLVVISSVLKKGDRYCLPALMTLPILAGWLLSLVWQRLSLFTYKKYLAIGVATLLLIQTLLIYPYPSAYASPLFGWLQPATQQGWGEGLDAAARFLNQQPTAKQMLVASWYPTVFSSYFQGQTTSLSSRDDNRVAYAVLYRNMYGRSSDNAATGILEEFAQKKPIFTVSIGGAPYVWVYDILGLPYFPRNTGELYGDMEIGQTVPINENDWHKIDIGLATFSSRANNHDVIFHIRESANAKTDLRKVVINAADIADSDWHTFEFLPINDSQGKTYYISLTSPNSVPGNAITVRYSSDDLRSGQMIWRGHPNQKGDIAYRLKN